MSLPSAQIQSIGKTARENAEAGAPAILDSALLEGLGISSKEQNFSLTGNVESTTTSVRLLLTLFACVPILFVIRSALRHAS